MGLRTLIPVAEISPGDVRVAHEVTDVGWPRCRPCSGWLSLSDADRVRLPSAAFVRDDELMCSWFGAVSIARSMPESTSPVHSLPVSSFFA